MEGESQQKARIWWRHWSVVFILAVLAAFVVWGLLKAGPWLRKLQDWQAARTLQSQLEKLYRDDNYGGKTPEETFGMFIAALEKGDVELASKFFVIEKQTAWMKTLTAYKSQALLGDFIKELKSLSRDQNMFKLYPSGVWKISNL